MSKVTRRQFMDSMWTTAAAAAAMPAASVFAAGGDRRVGANEILRVATVGVKGRGRSHVSAFSKRKDSQVVALVDVDENVIGGAMKTAEKGSGKKPAYYKDIRKMLEDKSIDAVTIATTNHTHSLFAIWAMQAGKHVYVEKPVSHNIFEGRQAVKASRKYNRVCQTGTQCRSNPGVINAIKWMQDGNLGELKIAQALCYKRRKSIGTYPDSEPPAGVDYDLWLGPAPKRPFNRNRFHYNWHWHYDYGNGDLGNQGIHQMDIARWGLGVDTLAVGVSSVGGRLGYIDQAETPNTQIVLLEYVGKQLVFEVRGLETKDYRPPSLPDKERGTKIGVIFHCEGGTIINPSYSSATAFDSDGKKIKSFGGGGDHFGNFLDACRSGKWQDLNADIEKGHLSSALCHMGIVSHRLGSVKALYKAVPFPGNDWALDRFDQMKLHLAQNDCPADMTQIAVGRPLGMDTDTEKFIEDEEANKLRTREYRKPFVVPEEV